MSELKATPGPWEWTVADRIKGRDPKTGNPLLVVRLLRSTDKRGNEPACQLARWDADAHLIAAATDLYAALDVLLADYKAASGEWSWDVQKRAGALIAQAEAALAKARGETK